MTDSLQTAQRIVGFIAALAFLVLAWQSMSVGYHLSWPVIVGTVVIVAMLLGKVEQIAHLIEKWRGGG